MNLSKSTISLRKQEMTECSNESTDYNLSVMHVFYVVFSWSDFFSHFLSALESNYYQIYINRLQFLFEYYYVEERLW